MFGIKISRILIIAGLLLLCACSANEGEEGGRFHTPEGTVITYLEGLRDFDLGLMSEAISVDHRGVANADEAVGDFITILNRLLDHFESPLGPDEFKSLEVVGFIPPEMLNELYASELNRQNLLNQAERLGAERLESRVVLFELGGETYIFMVNVADFDGEWLISDFGGNIGGLLYMAHYMQGLIPPEFVDEFIGGIDLESVMILP